MRLGIPLLYCDRSAGKKKAIRSSLLPNELGLKISGDCRWKAFLTLDPPSHEQASQSQQQKARLAPGEIPKQASRFVAMNFPQRFPGGRIEQINQLGIISLLKMVEGAADHPVRG